ncbi:laminin subunit alpha-1-like [Lineus longissimus]|uniref:laminin subunit alpha-1-like n=1 Tax=Lineus longissimus TaxID=88925 RepID=UPI00315DB5B6
MYFGGVPDSLNKILEELNVTNTKYLGCMREVQVSSRSLISQNILTGNYYGINPGCVVSARISGFYSVGYLELPPQEMSRDSDLSFSFVTMEKEGLIFLSRGEEEGDEHHVSISVIDGHVDARFNAGRGGVSIRSSKRYNDDLVHSVTIIKTRRLLDLVIDDEKVGSARLPRGPTKIALGDDTKDGIFIGGTPKGTEGHNASAATDKGFFGCVFNLVINGKLIYMDNNKGFKNADIGRCAVNHKEANLTANIVASPTGLPDSSFTIDPDPTQPLPTEPPSKCAKAVEYKDVPRGFSFGGTADSHGEIMLEPSILAGDFDITLDFRTFQPYGLMFYFMSIDQSEYLAMQMNNGKITLSYTPNPGFHDSVSTNIWYDDGNWHVLQFTKAGKKLAMALDGGNEFSANFQGGMNLEPKMYLGGLPESVVTGDVIIRTSFPGCLRNIRLLGIPLSLDSPGAVKKDVGTCYLQVEQGSYFSSGAYGIVEKNYFVGQEYNVRLDFRTNRLNGVLLSISNPEGFPALAIEVIDGRVKYTAKNKNGHFHAISNELQNLCDNKWHNIIAELIKNVVTIQVDHTQTEIGIDSGSTRQLETRSSMYLGGFPSTALPQGATHSNDTFVGCMKNLFINGRRVDMYKLPESNGINRASCPV